MSAFPQNSVQVPDRQRGNVSTQDIDANLAATSVRFAVSGSRAVVTAYEALGGKWSTAVLSLGWSVAGMPVRDLRPTVRLTPEQPYTVVPIDVSWFDELIVSVLTVEGSARTLRIVCRFTE